MAKLAGKEIIEMILLLFLSVVVIYFTLILYLLI